MDEEIQYLNLSNLTLKSKRLGCGIDVRRRKVRVGKNVHSFILSYRSQVCTTRNKGVILLLKFTKGMNRGKNYG